MSDLLCSEIVWAYASSPDAEAWDGTDSLVDAVLWAQNLAAAMGLEAGYICAGHFPDPGAVAEQLLELDDLLERMEEFAADNEIYAGDAELFVSRAGAREALAQALSEWGRTYVRATAFSCSGQPIRIRA